MGSNRARRDRQRDRREALRGNAVRFSGQITGATCLLEVLAGPPDTFTPGLGLNVAKLVPIKAVIDTGATASCVSPQLARRLGLVSHGKARVGVVGGSKDLDQAPILICFPSPTGTGVFKIIPVAIGEIAVPMLFGMRELAPGVLTVDLMNGTWEWKIANAAVARLSQAQTLPAQPPAATPPPPQPPPAN